MSTGTVYNPVAEQTWMKNLPAAFHPHCSGSENTPCANILHRCLSLANSEHSTTILFDQSFTSSDHLRLSLSCFLLPSTLPTGISVNKLLALITRPKYWSLQLCTVISGRAFACTSRITDALVRESPETTAVTTSTVSANRYRVTVQVLCEDKSFINND